MGHDIKPIKAFQAATAGLVGAKLVGNIKSYYTNRAAGSSATWGTLFGVGYGPLAISSAWGKAYRGKAAGSATKAKKAGQRMKTKGKSVEQIEENDDVTKAGNYFKDPILDKVFKHLLRDNILSENALTNAQTGYAQIRQKAFFVQSHAEYKNRMEAAIP
jgi:hypothetical protein